MYGYITVDKLNLYIKDHALYRAFYCGSCLNISKRYGQFPRATTSYDLTFFQVLMHSYLEVQPAYRDCGCLLNPLRKKTVVTSNVLLEELVDFNILMSYHNLNDDVIDGEGLKKILPRNLLKRAYKKAKNKSPEIDETIRRNYNDLRELEKANCDSVDKACHPFSNMLKECAAIIAKDKYCDGFGQFCYHIGKYIYLMDALDDLEKDNRKKNYNPFLAAYPGFTTREEYLKDNGDTIKFCINACINSAIGHYNNLELKEGRNLLDNIVHLALRRTFKIVYGSGKKRKREKI